MGVDARLVRRSDSQLDEQRSPFPFSDGRRPGVVIV
jgi:hypothetical protein